MSIYDNGWIIRKIKYLLHTVANLSGGGVTIYGPYASNSEAVAAHGVGILYESTTTIGPEGDASPIILKSI